MVLMLTLHPCSVRPLSRAYASIHDFAALTLGASANEWWTETPPKDKVLLAHPSQRHTSSDLLESDSQKRPEVIPSKGEHPALRSSIGFSPHLPYPRWFDHHGSFALSNFILTACLLPEYYDPDPKRYTRRSRSKRCAFETFVLHTLNLTLATAKLPPDPSKPHVFRSIRSSFSFTRQSGLSPVRWSNPPARHHSPTDPSHYNYYDLLMAIRRLFLFYKSSQQSQRWQGFAIERSSSLQFGTWRLVVPLSN